MAQKSWLFSVKTFPAKSFGMRLTLLTLAALAYNAASSADQCDSSERPCDEARTTAQAPMMVQIKSRLALQAQQNKASSTLTSPSMVAEHGHLRVVGNMVVDKQGDPILLQGMSLFWSQWMPQFWNAEIVRWLKNDWNVTLIRAAMAVENDGYLENPERERKRLESVVDAAISEGVYVIIDWHDHNANEHLPQATKFFDEMAVKYGKQPNVLFEIFNEPVLQEWSTTIKPYHQEIVRVIRQHSDNLIIMGTRHWSQDVDEASEDPVEGQNLAYTIHFYAASHKNAIRRKVRQALQRNVPIFATEWGTCEASGDGILDFQETAEWLRFFERHHISHANWAIGDKDEACAALMPGASGSGAWAEDALTQSGMFVRSWLRGVRDLVPPGEPSLAVCASVAENCLESGCCEDLGLKCYEKNEHWASCRAECEPGVNMNDPVEHRTPWSCKLVAAMTV